MLRPTFGLARAALAAGALLASIATAVHAGEPAEPLPGESSRTESVSVLNAARDGLLDLTARGAGETHVKLTMKNTSGRRLNVVIPAGLVAAASVGQGFQSMGLGTPTQHTGSFGAFQGSAPSGFQAVPVAASREPSGVAVPAGETIELSLPSVCLNYGVPTPTPRDRFRLVEVEEYTQDVRARKALHSLATLGTSQKVAQAVAWNVFNGMSFAQIHGARPAGFNAHELALAGRFIDALDSSSGSSLVEPDSFRQNRVFVQITGAGAMEKDAVRLAKELDGQTLLGLPIRVVSEQPGTDVGPSALFLNVTLTNAANGQVRGRVQARGHSIQPGWFPLGNAAIADDTPAAQLDAASLAAIIDRAVSTSFVNVRATKRSAGSTSLRLENRLPFTIANVVLRTGRGEDAGRIAAEGLGIGPARTGITNVPAASAVVERIELNGL